MFVASRPLLPASVGSVAWGDVTGKPAVIAAGADRAAVLAILGTGTPCVQLPEGRRRTGNGDLKMTTLTLPDLKNVATERIHRWTQHCSVIVL